VKHFNLIMIFSPDGRQLLFCQRAKEPFLGQMNFVGGYVEEGETPMASAYRELQEETGISAQDVCLTHLSTFTYHVDDVELQWFAGRLLRQVELVEEVNHLVWMPVTEDFFDTVRFAGQGNIGHMVREVQIYHPEIITDSRSDA